MVRELIEMPFRIAGTVVGGIAGVVRSRIGGGSSPPASYAPRPVPSAPTGPAAPAPKRPEPVRPHPEASDWDEDAPVQPGGSAPDDLIVTDRVKTQLFGA